MEKLQRYFDAIEAELSKIEYAAEPDGLYAPVRYELSLGGKREAVVDVACLRDVCGRLSSGIECGGGVGSVSQLHAVA